MSIENTERDTSGRGQDPEASSKSDLSRDTPEQLLPYISERLDGQISWYGKKAASNKFRFRICQLIIIIAGATIPVINLGIPYMTPGDDLFSPYIALGITAVLGGIITIVTALSQMDSYFETWVLYRTTAEALKRERFLYINSAADYSGLTGDAKNKLLVERIEAMLSSENSKFMSVQQNARQQSEQQLDKLLQQQGETDRQLRAELIELRRFREQYDGSGQISSNGKREVELVRAGLAGIKKFPINKESIQTYVEQKKAEISEADSVIVAVGKLPAKEYANIEQILNEVR